MELCVPWDAPEAVVDINSIGVVSLGSLPDKVGLFSRRMDAAPSRVLQGRDGRSTRFLVPDNRGVDQNFHDVTIVDMQGEREWKVSMSDLSHLRDSWPPAVFTHMKWHQQDLELMRKAAKRTFVQDRPLPCKYCGKVIRCDMYRHVSMFHLDLAQLWRCPVSWCTMWWGSPQDCMDHLRNAHDAPKMLKTATIERFVPPWTVSRAMWTESLRPDHSGISTDIMLFSDMGLSLVHHYRVHDGVLPHLAFRGDYLSRVRALLPQPSPDRESVSSPEAEMGATPTTGRRSRQPFRPVRVMSSAVVDLPVLTVQDPVEAVGASVVDCRPPVLPVSIPLRVLSPSTVLRAREAGAFSLSRPERQSIMDMDTSEITIERIIGYPWNDPGTDVEDELPTPAATPSQYTSPPVLDGTLPVQEPLREMFDLDLVKVLLDVSVMPTMVSPIQDPVDTNGSAVSDYSPPDIPDMGTLAEPAMVTPPRPNGGAKCSYPRFSPISEASSAGKDVRPTSSLLPSPTLLPAEVSPQSPSHEDTPIKTHRETFVVEASAVPLAGECPTTPMLGLKLLSEGPFEAGDETPLPGEGPWILDNLPGCQYRMTSYDERDNKNDMDPAYGIHLHDPV